MKPLLHILDGNQSLGPTLEGLREANATSQIIETIRKIKLFKLGLAEDAVASYWSKRIITKSIKHNMS